MYACGENLLSSYSLLKLKCMTAYNKMHVSVSCRFPVLYVFIDPIFFSYLFIHY